MLHKAIRQDKKTKLIVDLGMYADEFEAEWAIYRDMDFLRLAHDNTTSEEKIDYHQQQWQIINIPVWIDPDTLNAEGYQIQETFEAKQ